MSKTVEQRVIDVVTRQMGISGDHQVTAEKHIFDDLGADSLDAIEIIMDLEEEFEIELSDEAIEQVKTVQALADLIKREQGVAA